MNRGVRRLLVHQMAKVASMSWAVLGRQHFNVDEVFHIHHLSDERLDAFRLLVAESGPTQTIARDMILRERVRSAMKIRALLAARREDEHWLVVTGVRDPVARSASLLFYCADFLGCTTRTLAARDGATLAALRYEFEAMWDRALASAPPPDTFGRLLHLYVTDFESWFDHEFKGVLGMDVLRADLAAGPVPRVLAQGDKRVLLYRVEDMRAESPGFSTLRESVTSFCGAAVPGFPVTNEGKGRRSEPLYRAFLEQLRMPPDLLDRIYAGPTVGRFYLPAEIAAMKARWTRVPGRILPP
jgi:hypothetical protein